MLEWVFFDIDRNLESIFLSDIADMSVKLQTHLWLCGSVWVFEYLLPSSHHSTEDGTGHHRLSCLRKHRWIWAFLQRASLLLIKSSLLLVWTPSIQSCTLTHHALLCFCPQFPKHSTACIHTVVCQSDNQLSRALRRHALASLSFTQQNWSDGVEGTWEVKKHACAFQAYSL